MPGDRRKPEPEHQAPRACYVGRGMTTVDWKRCKSGSSSVGDRNVSEGYCREEARTYYALLSRQSSDRSVDEEIFLQNGKQQQQHHHHTGVTSASHRTSRGKSSGAAAAAAAAAAGAAAAGSSNHGAGGGGGGVGDERKRLDAERQMLLTILLAHMCASNDTTPRSFVEQVLVLYEAKMLDSIQFLFDLGFIPPVILPSFRSPADRTAVVEAVRRQINRGAAGDPLLLEAWPQQAAEAAAAAQTSNGGGGGGHGVDDGPATPRGFRVLSASRYLRDFEEEGLIARGSFGDVYRTRHRLDGTRYAIKKVVFRGSGGSNPRVQAVMREVQCLAQLDHKNIVRYHTSWLESGWVENGMGYTTAGTTTAAAASAAVTPGAGVDGDLRARTDALVPARRHSPLITGDSASESGSGWGWGAESDGGFDNDAAFGVGGCGGKRTSRGGGGGLGLIWGTRVGGDRKKSVSPQILSPKNLIVPVGGRDRGFSRWSAEDLESETSRWSEASSHAAGQDAEDSFGGSGGAAGAATAASRFRGGGAGGSGAAATARRWAPQTSRALRSEQLRTPPIDMDDVVSFRTSSSPTAGGADNGSVVTAQGIVEGSSSSDNGSNNGGWRDWDMLGGGCGSGGDGPGRPAERRLTRHGASPERLDQYPVTLYIQMTLCPSDTLHDWLSKRNSRLSAEAERARSGVLFEGDAHASRAPTPTSITAAAATAVDRTPAMLDEDDDHDARLLPAVLVPDEIDNGDGYGREDKAERTSPVTSPRTDPVTSASSGTSDGTSECSSSGSGGGSGGTRCPPPTRETSHRHDRNEGVIPEAFSTTAGEAPVDGTKIKTSTNIPADRKSPARSLSSSTETGSCDGLGNSGARVDLHEALRLFRQLVEGVNHIHSKGIIHRDIKPENVFVGEDGSLKIGDFGLSRTEAATPAGLEGEDDNKTTAGGPAVAPAFNPDPHEAAIVPRRRDNPPPDEWHTTGVGTASYASPEQLQGRRYGVRSDLFSLGLVLLELCCCFTTTHERAEAFQSIRQPGGSAPAHLVARSPAVARLAELLCRTVPEQRPSAEEILERLDEMDGRCGCEGCPGGIPSGGNERRGGRSGSGDVGGGAGVGSLAGDAGLREELAAKTRKVEEQEVLIGQLQRKLSELSAAPSPAIGPVNGGDAWRDTPGQELDLAALGQGLAALEGTGGVDSNSDDDSDAIGRGGGAATAAVRFERVDSASSTPTADGLPVATGFAL